MMGMRMGSGKGQTTIEYLLLISVVVLLFVGVLVTVNSLREEAQKTINVSGEEQTPVGAIGSQLDELRDIGSSGGGTTAPVLHLSLAMSPELPCAFEPITVTVTDENGPVSGATVTLTGEGSTLDTKSTATDGVAIFGSVQSTGTYVFSAEKEGTEPASLQFTVAC
jgi:hypothetical protein